MAELRQYQRAVINELYAWFNDNQTGHPCIVLPTGAGKSHIVAALCKEALEQWPETRMLMLTHQKELIEQNAQKLLQHWPAAPLGIYSAGIGSREIDQITFASIQSVAKRGQQLGFRHLVIIDECHLLNPKQQGQYRKLIAELTEINPKLRVIGLTATPYRLGHGYITSGKDALFTHLIQSPGTEVYQLIQAGFLSRLTSKGTSNAYDTRGLNKRGGEFIESQMQQEFNTEEQNEGVVREIIEKAENRRHWLLFCVGVDHALAIAEELNRQGVTAECVTGKTPKSEREAIIDRFRSGQTKALTNAMVLTTGFDFPSIDLVCLLRPTLSTGLYIQMVGRGLRLKEHTDHCRVLDFGGNIKRHGPITSPRPATSRDAAESKSPSGTQAMRECPECQEIQPTGTLCCIDCGHAFPVRAASLELDDESDIMGQNVKTMTVTGWRWAHYVNANGNEVLKCTYYPDTLTGKPVHEFFTLTGNGWAVQKAMQNLAVLHLQATGETLQQFADPAEMLFALNGIKPPTEIKYTMDGKFSKVEERKWN